MNFEEIKTKLSFAKRRFKDLCLLNNGDILGADSGERQMLTQEFFFHLVGSIEYLAQWVNEEKNLGLDKNDVNPTKVRNKLSNKDPVRKIISFLYANPRKDSNPLAQPDGISFGSSEEGLIYRIWNYRHQVVHRGRQAFYFFQPVGSTGHVQREAQLVLDPRNNKPIPSGRAVQADLEAMLKLVKQHLNQVQSLLEK